MFRTRDQNNRDQRFSSVPEESGTGVESWGDRLMLEPVKDDGRRVLSSTSPATPTGSSDPSDRYIVGVGATSTWAALVGDLVAHDGSSWVAVADQHTGAQVYSYKRDESLTIIETKGPDIPPSLSPEVLVYATTQLKFWMPNSLVDSFYSNWKGKVTSVTTASGSWAATMYNRYVVPVGDPTYSSLATYIATYIADMNTHTGKWVFQPAKEGDLLYSDGNNNFYYFDGTSWVVLASGNTQFYGAEGRQGAAPGLDSKVITAAVVDTFQKIDFDYSAITNLAYCPPSFLSDGDDTFTIPRYGIYAVGYRGWRVTYDGLEPDNITLCIKVNGTIVQQSTLPVIDDYEGEHYHGIFELELGDEVTFEFKTTGTNFDTELTINNGFTAYVYTVDAKGGAGTFVEHALNDHTDTNFPSPSDGDVIMWDDGTGMWVNGTPSFVAAPHNIISVSHGDSALTGSLANGQFLKRVGGVWTNAAPPTVEELNDTTFTGLAAGDLIQWNGSAWVNLPSTSISGVHTLDSHSNVNTAGKVSGSNLRWNGTAWVVYTPTLAGLSDVSISSPVNGQGLVYSGGVWTNGNPTATVGAVYYMGYYNGVLGWTQVSANGTINQVQIGVGGPYFFLPTVTGHYEIIVTGSITGGWGGGGTPVYGIFLNSSGGGSNPLGSTNGYPTVFPTAVAAHAVAYLIGGGSYRVGFGVGQSGFSPTSVAFPPGQFNISIKKIGN